MEQNNTIEIRQANAALTLQRLKTSQSRYNQFIPLPFALLNNPKFRNGLLKKARFRTYLWLRRHIVRGANFNDQADIYSKYWRKGRLATCISLDKLARDLKLPRSTASGHLDQLEKDGVIDTETIDTSDGRVCVLGWHQNGQEHWFIDDVFANREKSDQHQDQWNALEP